MKKDGKVSGLDVDLALLLADVLKVEIHHTAEVREMRLLPWRIFVR
jgi:ABC-type amino acid transport substrate-binding protein